MQIKLTEYFSVVLVAFIGKVSLFQIKWQKLYLNMTPRFTASSTITS